MLQLRGTVAEIDLDAIRWNMAQIRQKIGEKVMICPAVKADGYGHGAIAVSKTVFDAGAAMVGVASVEEAAQLRDAGITAPILTLGAMDADAMVELINRGISVTVTDLSFAKELSRLAVNKKRKVVVHVKIDTGMGRIGVLPNQAIPFIKAIHEMPGLYLEGVFTHFPSSDEEDYSFTFEQINLFNDLLTKLDEIGINIPLKHAANSGGVVNVPQSYYDMVRPGILVYGYFDYKDRLSLKPAMRLKTKIVYIKEVPKGSSISYGRTYFTSRTTRVATIPIGYADGYSRALSNRACALVGGVRVPVIGRVTMDQTMLDITDVPNADIGSEVVLYGKQGNEEISILDIAGMLGTVHQEILCTVGKRVPRVYITSNEDKPLGSIYGCVAMNNGNI